MFPSIIQKIQGLEKKLGLPVELPLKSIPLLDSLLQIEEKIKGLAGEMEGKLSFQKETRSALNGLYKLLDEKTASGALPEELSGIQKEISTLEETLQTSSTDNEAFYLIVQKVMGDHKSLVEFASQLLSSGHDQVKNIINNLKIN